MEYIKDIIEKLIDKITDEPEKTWIMVTTVFATIELWLTWFNNLPNSFKFPLILSVPLIFLGLFTLYNLAKDKWLLSKREKLVIKWIDKIYGGLDELKLPIITNRWEKTAKDTAMGAHGRLEIERRIKAAINAKHLIGNEESIRSRDLKNWLVKYPIDIPRDSVNMPET